MVHSFFYPDSVKAFTEAAAADPQCAIAYWGIAISHRPNPLILPLTPAVFKNGLEAAQKGMAIGAKTKRDWLAAIDLYYRDYDKVDQTTRGLSYEKAMEKLTQKYPDDPEGLLSTRSLSMRRRCMATRPTPTSSRPGRASEILPPEQQARLNLRPGEVRKWSQ
jgi:hypothetical protein